MQPHTRLSCLPATAAANARRGCQRWFGVLVVVICLGLTGAARAQTAGSLDPSFDPRGFTGLGLNHIVVQPDGKVLLGGDFREPYVDIGSPIIRLNPDGSVDTDFKVSARASEQATTMVVQPDGKIVVGGRFTFINGVRQDGITRLNADGSVDPTFNVSLQFIRQVNALVLQANGKLVVSADVRNVNGSPLPGLLRLNADGSLDPSFVPFAGAGGRCALQPDGKVLTTTQIGSIVRLNPDGSLDRSFDLSTVGGVAALVVQPDGKVVLGGQFWQANGVPCEGIARVNADGSLDASFNAGFKFIYSDGSSFFGFAGSLAIQPDGKLVVGGEFNRANGTFRRGLVRLNVDGSLDSTFAPVLEGFGVDTDVDHVAVQPDGRIIFFGAFRTVNGVGRRGGARLYAGEFINLPPLPPPVVSVVGAGRERGGFVVSRNAAIERPVTVFYRNGGSAVRGVDYERFSERLDFAAGQTEAIIAVRPLPGANHNRKVKVFLDPAPNGEYQVGKAQSKVFLSDLP